MDSYSKEKLWEEYLREELKRKTGSLTMPQIAKLRKAFGISLSTRPTHIAIPKHKLQMAIGLINRTLKRKDPDMDFKDLCRLAGLTSKPVQRKSTSTPGVSLQALTNFLESVAATPTFVKKKDKGQVAFIDMQDLRTGGKTIRLLSAEAAVREELESYFQLKLDRTQPGQALFNHPRHFVNSIFKHCPRFKALVTQETEGEVRFEGI
jgi:hypothetical protein